MKKTVLIVDDISFVRKTLADILTKAHYQVVGEARDGVEAVDMFNQLKPDMVTMDIVMPRMSGIDATHRILQMHSTARIVVVSAMGQENMVMEAIGAGALDYIRKPFSATDIIRTIDRLLARTSGSSKVQERGGT
jgi:two-component system chemotaxis response regulator CheY